MSTYFNPFVLPFIGGAIALLVICIWKYVRWFRNFDRVQRSVVKKNILSWKFLPTIWEAILECLLHRKVFRRNLVLGYMHASIAFGWFLLIIVGGIEVDVCLHGGKPFWVAIFYRFFVHETPTGVGRVFANVMDVLLMIVLSGVLLAVCKMIYSRIVGMRRITKHVLFDRFAKFSLWFIFPLRFLSEVFSASLYGNGGFITQAVGDMINPIANEYVEMTLWTLYSTCLGVFFVSLPFSRYMHIFTEVFLIYFRNLGVTEGDTKTGYTMYELSACSRCGICIDNCPMDKDLALQGVQSVYLLRDIRYKRETEEVANQCVLCQRCQSDCPVGLDLMAIRRQTRTKNNIDCVDSYKYTENIQAFNSVGRVLYFGGCMSHLTP
ncbi:MAG: 4Fe-4S dicluster domain-containing protein, partial [Bacteroidales bacterium]|nr:4Fe-4S dicluster domain-containing protein [Bacteroidales bacterium]